MDDAGMRFLRTKLKNGEYDGADIMQAWLAIDEILRLREGLRECVKPLLAAERERLALLAESNEDSAGFHSLSAAEIRVGRVGLESASKPLSSTPSDTPPPAT